MFPRSFTFTLFTVLAYATPERALEILKTSCAGCHSGAEPVGKRRLDTLDTAALVAPQILQRVTTTDRALRMPPTGPALPEASIAALREWAAGLAKPDYASVHPILQKNCYGCHSGSQPKSQLRLDAKAAALKGGIGGPVILPGKADDSRLIHRVEGKGGEQRMPLKGNPLTPTEIATLRAWINAGADWPGAAAQTTSEIEKHWSYKKPVRPAVPQLKVSNPIDAFVLAKLQTKGWTFSAPASKEKLIRRASLDLIGLPPTPKEVDDFLADTRPDAYQRLIDRLLASPRYGERWARHWLDLARYADTNGYEKDSRRTMWKYRDYVINAFNRDMPFDQFTIEQIAGDMLPNATLEQKLASGFNRNTMYNEEGGVDRDEAYFETLVDRVNTTSTVWLGSTLGCAQCHTHKYDPFTHKDYYQFMAFFNNGVKEDRQMGDTTLLWREPTLDLATPEQEKTRNELKARITAIEEKLKTPTPDLAREQTEWERSVLQAFKDWKPLTPASVRAEAGTELKSSPDGAIAASGPNPQHEVYTIEAPLAKGKLTGIRLDVLPEASLPRGGPGRDVYGHFVLTEVRVDVQNGSTWTTLPLKRFVADDGRVQAKGSPHLWTIDVSREDKRLPRQLVIVPEQPVEGSEIRVTLVQHSELTGQNIGRFRLSTTSAKDPTITAKLRPKLRPVLESSTRSPEDAKELATFFRGIAPSLQPARDELKARREEMDKLGVVTALVMSERPTFERPTDHVRIRGSFASKADQVWADVPSALGSLPPTAMPNRLGLARWLVSKDNPLTARVTINRIWEHYFGNGLVATTEDFGSQGERPSHPELLDWLAVEFLERGWSLKAMHRLIVTSQAYQQTSKTTPEILQADPYNRLLARGPKHRLEAEMIRDVALASSGLLAPKIGGPSVFPPQPAGVWDVPYSDEKWEESTGPDKYRRGIYTFVRRSALYPAMMNFDATSREFCTVRRARTNSPLAALTTLNDPAFFETSQAFARRIWDEGGASDASRIAFGFRVATSRKPTPAEQDRLLTWLDTEKKYFASHPEEAARVALKPDLAPWTMLANVLLNLDEALTKE